MWHFGCGDWSSAAGCQVRLPCDFKQLECHRQVIGPYPTCRGPQEGAWTNWCQHCCSCYLWKLGSQIDQSEIEHSRQLSDFSISGQDSVWSRTCNAMYRKPVHTGESVPSTYVMSRRRGITSSGAFADWRRTPRLELGELGSTKVINHDTGVGIARCRWHKHKIKLQNFQNFWTNTNKHQNGQKTDKLVRKWF